MLDTISPSDTTINKPPTVLVFLFRSELNYSDGHASHTIGSKLQTVDAVRNLPAGTKRVQSHRFNANRVATTVTFHYPYIRAFSKLNENSSTSGANIAYLSS